MGQSTSYKFLRLTHMPQVSILCKNNKNTEFLHFLHFTFGYFLFFSTEVSGLNFTRKWSPNNLTEVISSIASFHFIRISLPWDSVRTQKVLLFFLCVCRTKIYASLIVVYAKQAGKGVKNLGRWVNKRKRGRVFFLSEENDDIQVFWKNWVSIL